MVTVANTAQVPPDDAIQARLQLAHHHLDDPEDVLFYISIDDEETDLVSFFCVA